jgi:hypothetical protein
MPDRSSLDHRCPAGGLRTAGAADRGAGCGASAATLTSCQPSPPSVPRFDGPCDPGNPCAPQNGGDPGAHARRTRARQRIAPPLLRFAYPPGIGARRRRPLLRPDPLCSGRWRRGAEVRPAPWPPIAGHDPHWSCDLWRQRAVVQGEVGPAVANDDPHWRCCRGRHGAEVERAPGLAAANDDPRRGCDRWRLGAEFRYAIGPAIADADPQRRCLRRRRGAEGQRPPGPAVANDDRQSCCGRWRWGAGIERAIGPAVASGDPRWCLRSRRGAEVRPGVASASGGRRPGNRRGRT